MKPRVRGENQRHLKPPPSCMCRPSWRGEKWPTSNDGSSSVTIWIIWWICWLLVVVTLCVKDGWIRYTETWVFHQKTWLLGATLSLRDRSHPCFPCRSGFEGKLLQLGIGYAINFLTHQKKLKWWHSNRIPALNEMILPPPQKKNKTSSLFDHQPIWKQLWIFQQHHLSWRVETTTRFPPEFSPHKLLVKVRHVPKVMVSSSRNERQLHVVVVAWPSLNWNAKYPRRRGVKNAKQVSNIGVRFVAVVAVFFESLGVYIVPLKWIHQPVTLQEWVSICDETLQLNPWWD